MLKTKVKLLVTSGLFTAMVAALTFFPKIPIGTGYIHLGDSMIYLAACILPFPYALFVAGIGGAMADWVGGYAIWILPTLIIKALNALPFSPKSDKILTKRNALMTIVSGAVTIVGYTIAHIILFDFAGAIAGISGGAIQALGGAIVFVAVAAGLDKMRFKQKLLHKEI